GTDGEWGWDDTTSIAIADERLDNLRCPVTYREFADTLLQFQCVSWTSGGKAMKQRIAAGLFLCSLFVVVGGDAQRPNITEKPVWTLEFIKVRPENFGPAMGYLDDHWIPLRAEAKRRGAVLAYHRIQNAMLTTPGHHVGDPSSIVLLTEYKNMDAYLESRSREHLAANTPGFVPQGIVRLKPEDLFETFNTQVFQEEPDTSTGLKLLTKQ
ncbi:MAG: hypothetical protein DMG54_34210, partial [Acidobacteria bacterium]